MTIIILQGKFSNHDTYAKLIEKFFRLSWKIFYKKLAIFLLGYRIVVSQVPFINRVYFKERVFKFVV